MRFTLNRKINCLIIGIIMLPLLILTNLLFQNMRENQLEESRLLLEKSLEGDLAQLQKAVDAASMASEVLVNNYGLWEKIDSLEQQSSPDILDVFEFRNNYMNAIEKIVNTNPYLDQIRIYMDRKMLPEMMPVLYGRERMQKMSWAEEISSVQSQWFLDYRDTLYHKNTFGISTIEHQAGLVTLFKNGEGQVRVLEIVSKMDILFPAIYAHSAGEESFYQADDGTWYYDRKAGRHPEEILADNNIIYHQAEVPILGGRLTKAFNMKPELDLINRYRNMFLALLIAATFIVCIIADRIVKLILREFYQIMELVVKVEKGDIQARVSCRGNSEFTILGHQMNQMLSQIELLIQEKVDQEMLVKSSEIKALQNQINAHFIYNVLESIKMMAEIDEKYEMADAVTALGKLLRYSMKWSSKNVTVAEEVDYIKNYLALINLRFDYEIYLSMNMPEDIWKQEIPKMSLQPIIENAIYHGIEELAEDTSIYMKGQIEDGICTIEISDSGKGMTEELVDTLKRKIAGEIDTAGTSGNGIGLKNVQDRIQISFGREFGIDIMSKEGCYTKVVVTIPVMNCRNSK